MTEPTTPGAPPPHVVILGGGFGGLAAARGLGRAPVRITLVDRANHHLFQPLLYEVATAALAAPAIAEPIRAILRRQRNVTVFLGEARSVDVKGRAVLLADGVLSYDFLVLATGATHAYFGHDDWALFAPGLKTVADAFEMRRRVLLTFEAAERESDPVRRSALLTFVVVGGGATGVELAGALAEIARRTLARDFRNFDPASARVLLLEGAERVLPPFSPDLSASAERQLRALGVEVRTRTLVTRIDAFGVWIGAEHVPARTVLWAAGVEASRLTRSLEAPLDGAGRVRVLSDLSLPGHPEVFVVGDLLALEQDRNTLPGVAPMAIQSGRHAARNILHALRREPLDPFRYRDRGSMATIGRKAAVAQLGRLHVSGLPAWLLWLFVHLLFLIGFRNRLLVMFEWAWAYFTWRRGARVVLSVEPGPASAAGKGGA